MKNRFYHYWKVATEWVPSDLFYHTIYDGSEKISEPTFFSSGYAIRSHRKYTCVGEWFLGKPTILYVLAALIYYPIVIPFWYVFFIFSSIISLLLEPWE